MASALLTATIAISGKVENDLCHILHSFYGDFTALFRCGKGAPSVIMKKSCKGPDCFRFRGPKNRLCLGRRVLKKIMDEALLRTAYRGFTLNSKLGLAIYKSYSDEALLDVLREMEQKLGHVHCN